MEPRVISLEHWHHNPPPLTSVDAYYDHAYRMVSDFYLDVLKHYRALKPEDVTPELFLREYVWCVFASGFSSTVLAQKFEELHACYADAFLIDGELLVKDFEWRWERVRHIIANRKKHECVYLTVRLLTRFYFEHIGSDWWAEFKRTYLATADTIEGLPYIGPITKYHLARNLGIDAVKPDRHLTRLAAHFSFDSPLSMCSYLAGMHNERIGVIDLVLFYAGSTWGTNALEEAGCSAS